MSSGRHGECSRLPRRGTCLGDDGAPVNAIFFGLKRAYHGTLRVYRRALKSLGLTAARFDLLYVAREYRRNGVRQSTIRRELGVTAPTVSRMVSSLEALGLIRRERSTRDRRPGFRVSDEGGPSLHP